jgi:hypothetical protein
VVEDEIALNVDLFKTILEAAGISDVYATDGKSLRKLYTGADHRSEFYFQLLDNNAYAPYRAVRTLKSKYVMYLCDSTVEEYFDLFNDPAENTNQINNSNYGLAASLLKNKLFSFASQLGDEIADSVHSCQLTNPLYTNIPKIVHGYSPLFNPFDEYLFFSEKQTGDTPLADFTMVTIADMLGRIYVQEKIYPASINYNWHIPELPAGSYLLIAGDKKFLMQRR